MARNFANPVRHYREHDVCSLVSPAWALQLQRKLLRQSQHGQWTCTRRKWKRRVERYAYGATHSQQGTYQSTNYWVDVVFDTSVNTTPAPPTIYVATCGFRLGDCGTNGDVCRGRLNGPSTYQWRKNGAISGANSSSTPRRSRRQRTRTPGVVVTNFRKARPATMRR